MRFSGKWCAILGVLLLTSAADAGDPDQSGRMPDTALRSEILRGAHEAKACALKAERDNVVLADCAYKAHLRIDAERLCEISDNDCDEVLPMCNEWKVRIRQPMRAS